MTQPPHHGPGDADELARRRAQRGEGDARTLEQTLDEARRRLGEVAAERDALREKLAGLERELIGARQREWAEQQQRQEAEGEAAAARELAAGQVAELRQRLALIEAELANASAERDRAQRAVSEELARRQRLELREAALTRELARSSDLVTRAGAALSDARHRLADQRSGGLDATSMQRRLEAERRAFAERVAAVETAVATVRDRLTAAARALQQRLAEERAGRVAAESALAVEREAARRARMESAWLEGELARRAEAEAELRGALEGLRDELEAIRLGDGDRERRLAERVEDVQTIAASLRAGVARERDAEQQALSAALEVMQARLAELQAHAGEAAEAVRAELEAERAARTAAEARIDELEAELHELRQTARPSAPDPEALASLRAALEGLRAHEDDREHEPAEPDLATDLAAAARRLREAAGELREVATDRSGETEDAEEAGAATEREPEAAPEAEPVAEAEREAPAEAEREAPAEAEESQPELEAAAEPEESEPEPQAHTEAEAPAAPEAEIAPEPQAEPEAAAPVAPEPEASVAPPGRQTLAARGAVPTSAPWLRDALLALAADEPDVCELVLVAMLSAQAGIVSKPVTYDLAIAGGGTHRVTVEPDGVRVDRPSGPAPDARVAGALPALIPLGAGGARWRLPGAEISGRRALRRLLKARRAPVALSAFGGGRVALAPGLLLTLLAGRVPADWTAGERLAVDIAPAVSDRWRVAVAEGGGLEVLPVTADDQPAAAILHTTAAELAEVLAGTAPAVVEGDARAVRTLLAWFDRVQRGAH